jgi:hypothetical protein
MLHGEAVCFYGKSLADCLAEIADIVYASEISHILSV